MLIEGTGGKDTLIGTDIESDTIRGYGGDDILFGFRFRDFLFGGSGTDYLDGGAGPDRLDGGSGFDWAIYANSGAAVSVHLWSNANYGGEAHGDVLASIEAVVGSRFNDTIEGNELGNKLDGHGGNDELLGLGGDDVLLGADGSDTLHGGDNNDSLRGGNGKDQLFGDSNADVLKGEGGNDALIGGWGHDLLIGGAGNDTLAGGDGRDTLRGEDGADQFIFSHKDGGGKDVVVDFQNGSDTITLIGYDIETVADLKAHAFNYAPGVVFITLSEIGGRADSALEVHGLRLAQFSNDDFIFL